MKDIKIQDIEEFISAIEKGIEQFNHAINFLKKYRSCNHQLPIETLKKEKINMEEQLKEFKEKTLEELVKGETNSFNKLIAYKEILDAEIKIRE